MTTESWLDEPQTTITRLLDDRLDSAPDDPYIDVCGTSFTAAEVAAKAYSLANAYASLGLRPGDRVASVIENSPEALLAWWGAVCGGFVAVPVNTAYKGEYLRHQLHDSGARVLVVHEDFLDRAIGVVDHVPALEHVVVIRSPAIGSPATGSPAAGSPTAVGRSDYLDWLDLLSTSAQRPQYVPNSSDLGTFVYTGGTTGPSKGCMLSHHYHSALTRQIGVCWGRTADDVVWTPLPLYHFNALVTAVLGPLVFGGRAAISRRFSVSGFWPEMNRTGATVTSTLGTMAYLLAHDVDNPSMPRSGRPEANTSLRLIGAAPLPVEVDSVLRSRFGVETFSGAYGVTEASLISWQPVGVVNKPNAAGVINDDYFDVRIFDDHDRELARGIDGEIVIRPKRAHVMFEGYWGRPDATVGTSRNWWYHTGDIGRIDDEGFLYFVDRKADYLRRRGENISSFEVERILMSHGQLADVAVHAVPSALTEDDLKITATRVDGSMLTEEELFRWCMDRLPYFALPRYVEFRDELPRSPVGRVLKRELRSEGATARTWDSEASRVVFEKR